MKLILGQGKKCKERTVITYKNYPASATSAKFMEGQKLSSN